MTTWVIDTGSADRRDLLAWLRINEVNPNDVPADASLLVEEDSDGAWMIRYSVLLRNAEGKRYLIPKTFRLAEEGRVSPLLFDPPLKWLKPLA